MDLMNATNLLKETLIPMAIEGNAKMSTIEVIGLTLIGISVVFLGLIILILFVWVFGKIFTREKKPDIVQTKPETPKPVAAPASPAVVAAENNEDEVVAVIAAAIAAMGEAEGKTYRLKSVKAVKNKPARSAWSLAGIQNDTMPF